MSPFPTAINDGFAPGAPGDPADAQARIFTSHNYLAADDPDGDGTAASRVRAGNFAWALPEDAPGGGERGPARLVIGRLPGGADGDPAVPAGLVKRSQRYPGLCPDCDAGDPLAIPAGCAVDILEYATVYVRSATACAGGDAVFAMHADGSVVTGAAGAAPSGCSATGWSVVDGGPAGALITITR